MLEPARESRNPKPETTPDYFQVFGLLRKLTLDPAELEKEFYAQSRKLHPDRFAGKSVEEQEWATEQSSLLNDAYRTLKDPIARTEYLLSLEGVNMEEQSRAATDSARASGTEKKQVVPPELLEEVFEMNMQLQEMKMAHQMGEEPDAETQHGLEASRANFQSKLSGIDEDLKAQWTRWDAVVDCGAADGTRGAEVRDAIVEVLNRRSYVRNLVRDVGAALDG